MLISIVGVVILLGGLIFFHELGHYSVAKFFGIKVEVFSLGFGKKIFAKKIGDTEYCLSLIPLGGYVKLMGDDPYKPVPVEESARAFSTQKLYKRFLVVAAGPVSNLVLAYILFVIIFALGQPQLTTRLGNVQVNSPAWTAGLRNNDKIVAVDSTPVTFWNELEENLKRRFGEKVELKVDRAGTTTTIPYTVGKTTARNAYGEEEEVGGIKGISQYPIDGTIGISNPETPAYKAGLRTGDQITRVGSKDVATYEDVLAAINTEWKTGQPVTISVSRLLPGKTEDGTPMSFPVVFPDKTKEKMVDIFSPLNLLGVYPSDVFVRKVSPGEPAELGGLKNEDRIVQVGGQTIYNFDSIVDTVQAEGKKGSTVPFLIERAGKLETLNLKPESKTSEDFLTHLPVTKFRVGFAPWTSISDPEIGYFKIHEPVRLLKYSYHETYTWAKQMVVSIWKLATRKMPAKNLGGPVMIAQIAGQSLKAGLTSFLRTMALISLNLFLLNLLPVPVLDGGHLFFFVIEALKGKPVSVRTMEIATQLGMFVILGLVGLTLFNDITRIVLH